MMKTRTGLAVAAVAAATVVATVPAATSATAASAPTSSAGVSQAATTLQSNPQELKWPNAGASVAWGAVSLANKIYNLIAHYTEIDQNRSGLVQAFQNGAWYESGESKNVLVIKADHPYQADLQGIEFDATYDVKGYPKFRVVVFESGTVTNNGDGGYINWAYRGWFDRQDMTVNFHKP